MSGYRLGISHFFIFFVVNFLNHLCNVTFAMWCVSIRRNFAEASLIANASLIFLSLSCGYFIQAASLPVWVRWIKYLSYIYHGFAALSSNGNNSLDLVNKRIQWQFFWLSFWRWEFTCLYPVHWIFYYGSTWHSAKLYLDGMFGTPGLCIILHSYHMGISSIPSCAGFILETSS